MPTDSYGTHGTFTWTAPAGVFSVQAYCVGAGGGGAGGTTSNSGGGGGGGASANRAAVTVIPGNGYTVTVGTGGTAGNGGSGGNGGDSSFQGEAGVGNFCQAKGAGGGIVNGGGAFGDGSLSTGDTNYNGGAGSVGPSSENGGGGGGSAGSAGIGNSVSNSSTGATAVTNGGPGGNGSTSSGNGAAPASGSGGGGGGGANTNGGGNTLGGVGWDGAVTLTYTINLGLFSSRQAVQPAETPPPTGDARVLRAPPYGIPPIVPPGAVISRNPPSYPPYEELLDRRSEGRALLLSPIAGVGRVTGVYVRSPIVSAEDPTPLAPLPPITIGGRPFLPVTPRSLRPILVNPQSDDPWLARPGEALVLGGKPSTAVTPPYHRLVTVAAIDRYPEAIYGPASYLYGGQANTPTTPPLWRTTLFVPQEDVITQRRHPEASIYVGPYFKLPPGAPPLVYAHPDDHVLGYIADAKTMGGRAPSSVTPPMPQVVLLSVGPSSTALEPTPSANLWTTPKSGAWAPSVTVFCTSVVDVIDAPSPILPQVPLKSGLAYLCQVRSVAPPVDTAPLEAVQAVILRAPPLFSYILPKPQIITSQQIGVESTGALDSNNLLVTMMFPTPVAAYPLPAPPTELEPNTYISVITLKGRSA